MSMPNCFDRSRLYALLSDRETGLWHVSTDMLLELYREEKETGTFNLNLSGAAGVAEGGNREGRGALKIASHKSTNFWQCVSPL